MLVKKVISIGLIFVLSLQCLYQIGIVTYFNINRDYIAQVLCINKEKPMTMCYGNCFLKRNLKVGGENEKSTVPVSKIVIEAPSFIVSEFNYSFSQSATPLAFLYGRYYSIELSGFPSTIFHPPSFLA